MDLLVLVNEFSGASEVGTLFVEQGYRGRKCLPDVDGRAVGAGRLIAQARYMLMAGAPVMFGDTVIAELRGLVDDDGVSVFWQAVGRKFFHMDFGQADHISAATNNDFIVDLMPKHPIYVDLLSEPAHKAIGVAHPKAIGAQRLLEDEGFSYDRMIDIFDGGPNMRFKRDQIRTVRDSEVLKCHVSAEGSANAYGLISNNKFKGLRATFTAVSLSADHVDITPDMAQALNLNDGDNVRIWMKL